MLDRLRPAWPLITLIGSGALLAGAHAFERIGGFAPCPLCLAQRQWHWAVVAVSLAALILARFVKGRGRTAAFVIGVVLLGAFAQAAHHVAVEQHWITWVCDANIDTGEIRAMSFDGALEVPQCDTPAWTLLGISMAGYNAIFSLVLALLSFAVALLPERRHG